MMDEPLTPEQARAKIIADLMALPGPKPLRPIPPEVLAEALADIESEEEWERQLAEVLNAPDTPIEPLLEQLDRMVEEAR